MVKVVMLDCNAVADAYFDECDAAAAVAAAAAAAATQWLLM